MKKILTLESGKEVIVLIFRTDDEVYAEVMKSAFSSEEELQEIKSLCQNLEEDSTDDVRVIAEIDYNISDAEANQ